MKIKISISLTAVLMCALQAGAQVGVATTTPDSMLDVRGSLSLNHRAFTSSTEAGITDNMLVFTGATAATITLRDAIICNGRVYWLKNTSSNTSLLTIATTASQTIEGLGSWLIDESNDGMAGSCHR